MFTGLEMPPEKPAPDAPGKRERDVLRAVVALAEIKARLRLLYRAAAVGGKFVNLDMEEYRDRALTATAFREVLDEPEFHSLSAGIVLQADLPDSNAAQRELTGWAQRRVAAGGAKIKVRLVKGANLAMETVEAELLEGRANHQARAVRAEAGGLLVYAPLVHAADFGSALA